MVRKYPKATIEDYSKTNEYSEFWSGSLFCELKVEELFSNDIILAFFITTDGTKVWKSQRKHIV